MIIDEVITSLLAKSLLCFGHSWNPSLLARKVEHLMKQKNHSEIKLWSNAFLITYVGNSISKLQIQVTTYVFVLSAGNCHR